MGHLQNMTREQKCDFISESYQRKLDANKGHNFEYWNEKHVKMLDKGYVLYLFNNKEYTPCEITAKAIVVELRNNNNYARIVCGYEKIIQRIKYFSVIYKPK